MWCEYVVQVSLPITASPNYSLMSPWIVDLFTCSPCGCTFHALLAYCCFLFGFCWPNLLFSSMSTVWLQPFGPVVRVGPSHTAGECYIHKWMLDFMYSLHVHVLVTRKIRVSRALLWGAVKVVLHRNLWLFVNLTATSFSSEKWSWFTKLVLIYCESLVCN